MAGCIAEWFHSWLNREPSERDQSDKELRLHIKRISDENEGRYGSPRIWKALLKQGFQVSRKRVARLMQEMGLIARVTKVTYDLVPAKTDPKVSQRSPLCL